MGVPTSEVRSGYNANALVMCWQPATNNLCDSMLQTQEEKGGGEEQKAKRKQELRARMMEKSQDKSRYDVVLQVARVLLVCPGNSKKREKK